jgi:thiamine biosynthesis lipoprotein
MAAGTAAEGLGRTEFPVWGGHGVVAVGEPAGLDAAVAEVSRTVAAFDLACSSFRDSSEIALLNTSSGREVAVSPLLFAAVREALRAARVTGGAVDPTVGQSLVALRINPRLNRQPVRIEPAPGYTAVRLNEATSGITLPFGVQLDLGATAKALAADMAAAAATAAAGCGVLVGLCGDIAVAGPPPEAGWQIRVTDDHRHSNAPGQTISIRAGGLATSSITVRRVDRGGTAVNHLIDPATGRSIDGPWRTASVTAGSCLDANTASTAAIVLGAGATDWLGARRLPARLVGQDARVRYVAGWPEEGDDL